MSTQYTKPFACRQCLFCKDAFRIDGGATGIDSFKHGGWVCSGGCLQLANLFSSEPGEMNHYVRDALIKTYNKCYIKTDNNGNEIHIPRLNSENIYNEISRGNIYLIKSVYEHSSEQY